MKRANNILVFLGKEFEGVSEAFRVCAPCSENCPCRLFTTWTGDKRNGENNWVVRAGFTEEVTFEKRLKEVRE